MPTPYTPTGVEAVRVSVCSHFILMFVCAQSLSAAITLAHAMRLEMAWTASLLYVAAQLIGAVLAGLIAWLEGSLSMPTADPAVTPLLALSAEAIFSFALCLVHLDVLAAQKLRTGRRGNGFFGLAMGLIFHAGTVTVGEISGGVFNPAAGIGVWIASALTGGGLGIGGLMYYIVGPVMGACLAQAVHTLRAAAEDAAFLEA
jgi:aquaporin Z